MSNIMLDLHHANQDHYVQHFVQGLQNRLPQGINIEIHNGGMLGNAQGTQLPSINIYFQNDNRCRADISLDKNYHTHPGNIDILGMQANDWQNVLNIITNGFQGSVNFLQQNYVDIDQNILNAINTMANNHNNNVGQHNLHNANGQQNNLGSN